KPVTIVALQLDHPCRSLYGSEMHCVIQSDSPRIMRTVLQRTELRMGCWERRDGLEMRNSTRVALRAVSGCDLSQVLRAGVLGVARAAPWSERLGGFMSGRLVTLETGVVSHLFTKAHHLK